MIAILDKIRLQKRQKKALLAFLDELDKDLELFYVMDQRQFITQGFALKAWEEAKNLDCVKKHDAIRVCMAKLEEFNKLYQEYKEYEQWYSADLNRKSQGNARKLHGMKHELDKKLRGLDAVIIPAGAALEKEMLALKVLKNE